MPLAAQTGEATEEALMPLAVQLVRGRCTRRCSTSALLLHSDHATDGKGTKLLLRVDSAVVTQAIPDSCLLPVVLNWSPYSTGKVKKGTECSE